MNKYLTIDSFSVKDILSRHTVSDLTSIAKDLHLRGYSGKNKGGLVDLLYQKVTDKTFLEDLLLICDRQIWECLLIAASSPTPTPLPSPVLEPCNSLARLGLLQRIDDEAGTAIMMPPEIKSIFGHFKTDGFIEQKDRSDLLDHYALAVTRLYGIIRQDEFVAIFNAQNTQKTDIDEVFSVLIQHISADAPYGFWNEYLTHSLFEDNEYKDVETLLHSIAGKQRFVPTQELLLQYKNPYFYEKTPASERFERYFAEKFAYSKRKPEEITSEFSFACSIDTSLEKALNILNGYTSSITKEDVREIIPLLVNLANHTRKWSNCGYTPEEMRQRSLRNQPVRQGRKIGRNEPCPCGSGKKYKKCCGR